MASGIVEAIWLKRARGGVMDRVPRARCLAGRGLEGNADQGGKRQVTLIEREQWEAMMAEVGGEADPASRRANVLVRGIALRESRGRVLQIGSSRFRVWGETRPCEQMEEATPGLREAMRKDWRGGVFAEVLEDGEIVEGDEARWAEG